MNGAYDQAAESMEMSMDLGELFAAGASGAAADDIPPGFEGFFDEPMDFITIGTEGWLRWGILSLLTGQESAWISLESDELGSATESFGFGGGPMNPTDLLDTLAEANADVEDLGTENVRGVETNHLRALIDVQNLANDLDPAEQAELEEQLGDLSNAEYPIDLWVGVDDGLLYRYEVDLQGEAIVTDEASADASVLVSFEFYDHGQSFDISPPAADEIVDGSNLVGALD